jgi:hypothetical protein
MVEAKVEGGRSTGTKHHNPYKSSLNVSEVSEINYQVSEVKVKVDMTPMSIFDQKKEKLTTN